MKKILKFILIAVAILILGVVILGSGGKKEDTVKKEKTKTEQKYSDEEIEQAYRKCVVQEIRDIYITPAVDQESERENAIDKAKEFCDLYKTEYEDGLNAIVEDTTSDWEQSGDKDYEFLGHTLTWWYENYDNLETLYKEELAKQ